MGLAPESAEIIIAGWLLSSVVRISVRSATADCCCVLFGSVCNCNLCDEELNELTNEEKFELICV